MATLSNTVVNGTLTINDGTRINVKDALNKIKIQIGKTNITPVANTVSSASVKFSTPFTNTPVVVASALSGAPGTAVTEVTISDCSKDGFTLNMYRTDNTTTSINWIAVLLN